MSQRAGKLHDVADAQIAELVDLVSSLDTTTLGIRCAGREKLGDGTVAALAQHTADSYQRIATFLCVSGCRGSGVGHDGRRYTVAAVVPEALLEQLANSRATLTQIADLTDSELDAVPAAGSFRFCDGQRNLQQVVKGLLAHQAHQVAAIRAAMRP
jgi:hypothetical protein